MPQPDETVEQILKRKVGRIRNAPLEPGSPQWDNILKLTWAEIQQRAALDMPGYRTIKKLLSDARFDR